MANNFFQQEINITLRLRVNGKLREDGNILLCDIEIDTGEQERFIRELAELCEKYNYAVEAKIIKVNEEVKDEISP